MLFVSWINTVVDNCSGVRMYIQVGKICPSNCASSWCLSLTFVLKTSQREEYWGRSFFPVGPILLVQEKSCSASALDAWQVAACRVAFPCHLTGE